MLAFHLITHVWSYCRVSSAGQEREGTSLEGQHEAHCRWCAAHGLPPPTLVLEVESGGESKQEARHEQIALIARAQPGELIIVSDTTRWSRDMVYGVGSVRKLVKRGVDWYELSRSIDASTPQGDSVLGLMMWCANEEHKKIRERTVDRRRTLKAAGHYVEGKVPRGYLREPRRPGGGTRLLRPDPVQAPLVVEMFERCARGESLRKLVAWGIRAFKRERWEKHHVATILRHRIYLGEVQREPGVWIAGLHEAIITADLFERAGTALDGRKLGGRLPTDTARTAAWLMRSLATCGECGARMASAYRWGRGRNAGSYLDYYACRGRMAGKCSAPYVRVDEADRLAGDAALARLTELRADLARLDVPVAKVDDGAGAVAEAKLAKLKARRARTLDMAAEGMFDREDGRTDLRARLAKLDAELGKAAQEVAAVERAHATSKAAADPAARRALLADVRALAAAWGRMPGATRREVLARLAASITLKHGESPRIVWRSAAEMLTERV